MARTPSPHSPDAHPGSRASRLARRRHKAHLFIAVGTAVLLAAAGALAAYSLQQNSPVAQADPTVAPETFGNLGTVVPSAAQSSVHRRPLTHAQPLRLWVGGDSLAGLLGPALGDLVGATGVGRTVVDYKVSSGLWSNDIRDWDARATEQMTQRDPEAVVYIIGTNDTQAVNNVDANGDGTPDWQPLYRAKVDKMMETFVGGAKHRTVYWLGAPTLGTQWNDEALALDNLMREEARKFAPDVVYIDTYKLFSAPDGTYSRTITDEHGNQITARIGDGVHFSSDGAAYLARYVFTALDTTWRLVKHADTANPIGWTFADGNGELVPGYSSTPRSRYNSSSNSNSYSSPPPTAPPATTPVTAAPVTTPITSPPATSPATTPKTSPPVTSPPATTPPKTTPPVSDPKP